MHKHYKLKGSFKIEIVDEKTQQIERALPHKNNLILNQGLDFISQRSFVENILSCAVGSGTTPPLLTDTGLLEENDRTNQVDTTVEDACETLLNGTTYSLKKTFRFNTKTAPTPVGEIGWSYSNSPGANLFSKSLIIDENENTTVVVINPGKYLRVTYTLEINFSPTTATIANSSIDVWPTASGVYSFQLVGLRSILTNGNLSFYDAGNDCNEPSASGSIFIGTDSTAPTTFGSSVTRGGTNYSTGVFNKYLGNGVSKKYGSFGKNVAANSSLRSMGIGAAGSATSNTGAVFVFDSNQTKGADFILVIELYYSWSAS